MAKNLNALHPSVLLGSIISPLLFSLFINDLPILIKTNILLFADDLKLFSKITCINDVFNLQNDINTIFEWCERNYLQQNRDKCCFISSPHNFSPVTISIINIQQRSIKYVIWALFDSKLSFEPHLNQIIKSSFKILGFISKSLYKFRNIDTYTTLYSSKEIYQDYF